MKPPSATATAGCAIAGAPAFRRSRRRPLERHPWLRAGGVLTALLLTPFLGAQEATNTPPTLTAIADQVVAVNTSTPALDFIVDDLETPASELALMAFSTDPTVVPAEAIVFGGSGRDRTVTLTPAANTLGSSSITISVTDEQGGMASIQFSLTVDLGTHQPPVFILQPTNQTCLDGEMATLAVSAASSLPVAFQWYRDTAPIAGATADQLTLNPARLADAGPYFATASNLAGASTSLVAVLTVLDPPFIVGLTNRTVPEDTSTGPMPFTIGDSQTPASNLVVTASSSNTILVRPANMTWSGTGTDRTLAILPRHNATGSTLIRVIVSDGTLTATNAFTLTVSPVNDPPQVPIIADTVTGANQATADLAFTISDPETSASLLTVTATSSNAALVPPSSIQLGGTTATRWIRLTPAQDQVGIARIAITVRDPQGATTTSAFWLTVIDSPAPLVWENLSLTNATYPNPLNLKAVAHANGRFVALGTRGDFLFGRTTNAVLWSTDSREWRESLLTIGGAVPTSDRLLIADLFAVSNRFYAVGNIYTNGQQAGLILSSSDGLDWTGTTLLNGEQPVSIGFGNGLWIVALSGGAPCLASANGMDWAPRGLLIEPGPLVFAHGLFITANGNRIRTSPDGWEWTLRCDTGGGIDCLATDGARVLAGGAGFTHVSTNGLEWTVQSQYTIEGLRGLTHGLSRFAAAGGEGRLFHSTDGFVPHPARADRASGFADIAFGNGVFVAVGGQGALFRSGVIADPLIHRIPDAVSIPDGSSTFLRGSVQGTLPLTCQWLKDDVPLAGATAPTLALNTVTPAHAGIYALWVSNRQGTALSPPVRFTVTPAPEPPSLVTNPTAQTATLGTTVTLSVVADGTSPLLYQWQHQGTNLPLATNATLRLPNLLEADLGEYSVTVANGRGSITSTPVPVVLAPPEAIVAWGGNEYGQASPPAGLTNVADIAAGAFHSIALKSDGTVVGWGDNRFGQAQPPESLTNAVAIEAGGDVSAALRADGTVVPWGNFGSGTQPTPEMLRDVSAVSVGGYHTLLLKTNGTVTGWGNNLHGELNVPPHSNIRAISAGTFHNLALKSDGTVIAWGDPWYNATQVPPGLDRVTAVYAAYATSIAIREDGTVLFWGATPPPPMPITQARAIASGSHVLILNHDGTVFGYGYNSEDQASIPAGLSNVVAIAGGARHSVALRIPPPAPAGGARPFLGPPSPVLLPEDTPSNPLPFQVGDEDSPVESLYVIAESALPALIPTEGIALEGSGTDRSLVITPAPNAHGSTYVTLTVTDGTLASSCSFLVTVQPVNDPPHIASPPDQTLLMGQSTGPIELAINDPETEVASLALAAEASNPTLLPPGSIQFAGWNPRTMTVTPAGAHFGEAILMLTVTDPEGLAANASFHLTVLGPPGISAQPESIQRPEGTPAALTVIASGIDPLAYQWHKDQAPLPGATNATLEFPALTAADTGTYYVAVTDSIGTTPSAEATVSLEAPGTIQGTGLDGYLVDARVFFDANRNGRFDAGEPETQTDARGRFALPMLRSRYDTDRNGHLDPAEGTLILEGGFDIATGLPHRLPLAAPPAATVINPLTTVVTALLDRNPALGIDQATSQLNSTIGLSHDVEILHYDPLLAAAANDPAAVAVLNAGAQLEDTRQQITALLGAGDDMPPPAEVAAKVTAALASRVLDAIPLDLTAAADVAELLQDSARAVGTSLATDTTRAAAAVISQVNAIKADIASAGLPPAAAAAELVRAQIVAQDRIAADLAEAARGALRIDDIVALHSGAALDAAVKAAPVGDLAGTESRVGTFGWAPQAFRVTEDHSPLVAPSIIRADGTRGAVRLRVTVQDGSATQSDHDHLGGTLDVTFADGELSRTLPLDRILVNDAEPEPDETLLLTLALAPDSPPEARLASASVATVTILDDDAPGVFAFNRSRYDVGEDGSMLTPILVTRQGGTSGSVTLVVTPRAVPDEASPWTDFSGAPITLVFAPGDRNRMLSVPVARDALLEEDEALALDLTLAPEPPPGAMLGSPSRATLIIQDDPSRRPVVRLSAAASPDGIVRISLSGTPGQSVVLERSEDLKSWHLVARHLLTLQPLDHTVSDPRQTSGCFFRATAVR